MSSLQNLFHKLIRADGPQSIARLMQIALTFPNTGYYNQKKIFGVEGDFITSPEISQLFGEMIGLKLVSWAESKPSNVPLELIELGPGRGTLMADILRTTSQFKSIHDRITKCRLIEVSERLKGIQHENLKGLPLNYQWYSSIDEVETEGTGSGKSVDRFILAHEFFDALPIHVFQKQSDGNWREVLVGLNDKKELAFVLSPRPTAMQAGFDFSKGGDASAGAFLEFSPESVRTAGQLKKIIFSSSNAMSLICDYGELSSNKLSLRAIRNQEMLPNIFQDIGEADLSADVDFGSLIRVFQPESSVTIQHQGNFLQQMGIYERAKSLLARHSSDERLSKDIATGYQRLVDPKQMGSVYKVLTVVKE